MLDDVFPDLRVLAIDEEGAKETAAQRSPATNRRLNRGEMSFNCSVVRLSIGAWKLVEIGAICKDGNQF